MRRRKGNLVRGWNWGEEGEAWRCLQTGLETPYIIVLQFAVSSFSEMPRIPFFRYISVTILYFKCLEVKKDKSPWNAL